MHSSRAPPPTRAARRSYRRTMRTSSPSTAACPATPRLRRRGHSGAGSEDLQ